MSRDDGFPRSLRRVAGSHSRVAENLSFPFMPGSPVSGRHARFEALLPPGVRSLTTRALARARASASVLSWAFSPPEHAPSMIPGSVSHGSTRCRGDPDRVCLRELSHLASRARPELRSLGSRTQDLPARCGRSNPRATVRRPPSLEIRSRRFSTPVASLTPLGMRRLACAPSRRRPAPPAPLAPATRWGWRSLDLGDAV